MTAFLIKGLSRKAIDVFRFSDVVAARRADEARFREDPTTVVERADDLESKGGPALVSLYNGLIEDGAAPVARFATRSDGARRVFAVLVERFSSLPLEDESKNALPVGEQGPGSETNATEEGDDVASKKGKKKAKGATKPRIDGGPKKPKGEKKAGALVREESSRGKLLKLAVANPGISVASLAKRADVSAEGSTSAEQRVRLRLRKVAENVGGTVDFGTDGAHVTVKLPSGMTLDKVFGR